VVFPNGNIEKLLDESLVSNGVQGYNSTSINVAYVGGIDNKGRAVDNRTDLQKAALLGLLEGLKLRYPNAHIMGHRDIWGKDKSKWKKMCPCFDAEAEYAHLDDAPIGKYDDAIEDFNNEPEEEIEEHIKGKLIDYSPEYILDKPRDYTGFLKSLRPW
jgi:N-acetylmuramoyl-L-alanine amidase